MEFPDAVKGNNLSLKKFTSFKAYAYSISDGSFFADDAGGLKVGFECKGRISFGIKDIGELILFIYFPMSFKA